MIKYFASILVSILIFEIDALSAAPADTQSNCPSASEDALTRFKEGLKIPTVCWAPGNYNKTALVKLREHIQRSYPTVHSNSQVQLEIINSYSLLYKITAENPSDPNSLPFMFMGHLDVVPVEGQTWTHPPFDATTDDQGFIHARGSVDCKHNIFSMMEALETFLKAGHKFTRSFYIFYGHDEECLGTDGAKFMAEKFKTENVKLDWIQDEGAYMVKAMFPGVEQWVASVAVAEKGFMTLGLEVEMVSKHSSVPPPETSITKLAKAVLNINDSPQPHHEGEGLERKIFEKISNCVQNDTSKKLYQNFDTINGMFSQTSMYKAMTRSTTAVTIFNAGVKENIIPAKAEATVNFRIHPLDTIEKVKEHFKNSINDTKVEIKDISESEPVSPSCSEATENDQCHGYAFIEKTLGEVWSNDVITVPVLLAGMTDSRHFKDVAKNIYRFSPIGTVHPTLFKSHGENECISIGQYSCMIQYYSKFLENFKA